MDDLIAQQRQAANRVRQMQDHARQVFEAHQGHLSAQTAPSATALCRSPRQKPTAPLRLEEDQWLLLLLALLLFRCGCRTELLLALVYLAL